MGLESHDNAKLLAEKRCVNCRYWTNLIGKSMAGYCLLRKTNPSMFSTCSKWENKPARYHIQKPQCDHVWGIDGAHSNEYCKKCFIDKPKSLDS